MKTLLFLLLALIGVPSSCAEDNCTTIDSCQECVDASCHWIQCFSMEESCQQNLPAEQCREVSCNSTTTTTAEPPTTETTTAEPTTTETPEPTTETPTEPTTTEPATTEPVTTPSTKPPETTTVQPTTTTSETPTTEAPTPTTTEPTTAVPTTTPSPCPGHHFDAGSFFGGIFLAVGVLVVSYAGLRFYRARNGRNYNQLQTVY